MKRCDRCRDGKLPARILVQIQAGYVVPRAYPVLLRCPRCLWPLSVTSRRKLNHRMLSTTPV